MKDKFLLTDTVTEQIFSIVRWIFLVVAVIVFYYPPIASIVNFELHTFNYLLIFGITYMTVAQIALWLAPGNHTIFKLLMKTGILFDYIALIWLLFLTGGVTSTLFPISYLLVMHSTIYWKIHGAVLSCTVVVISYFILFWTSLPLPKLSIVIFLLNLTFLIVIGFFGALIVNRERHHQKLQYVYKDLIVRDYLTGLYNHRHFQETLKNSFSSNSKSGMAVVLADIDNFKKVNDTHGHVVGDKVLMKIGEILQNTIPSTLGNSFRYGGEEFAILFNTADNEKIIPCLEKVYKELREVQFVSENGSFSVTMSFGLFSNQQGISNQVEIVRRADKLLYKAKHNGKNQAIFDCGTVIRG
ncbi:GGDEF domain-containing protein [Neobacillus niacini]|uniref:GGDEF domain-containing protein n=1 Tax=Neobacillus niacini TaxID=86668 RepID=UPI00203D18FF|nr:diguanylate cyclase [Neobacillus niacini]MCM3690715.1 diguanylate cyclase [Neobacillus niacini]